MNRLSGIHFVIPLLLSTTLGAQQPRVHALDPLSANEITRTVTLLRDAGHLTPQSRFGTITVQPQPKNAPATRAARVIGHDWSRNEGFLAVVDLDRGRVSSWTVVDSEPPMRLLTIRRAEEIAHADARWVAALRARGIDTARVSVLVSLPERAKLPREGNDRVVPAFVWLRDGVPDGYVDQRHQMRVNLTQGRLESFEDNGAPIARHRLVGDARARIARGRRCARWRSGSRRAPRRLSAATRSPGIGGRSASASIRAADSRCTTSRSRMADVVVPCSTADRSARSSPRTAIRRSRPGIRATRATTAWGSTACRPRSRTTCPPTPSSSARRCTIISAGRSSCRKRSPSTSETAESCGGTRTCRGARGSSS